mmetsp:Transcript_81627/g.141891  ORF Transcript_81627/g.141891 Transcript_81627/m.141891 type:complete len:653 (-) Transcript_81627:110-2068(-)
MLSISSFVSAWGDPFLNDWHYPWCDEPRYEWEYDLRGLSCNTFGDLISMKLFCWMGVMVLWRRHCLNTFAAAKRAKREKEEFRSSNPAIDRVKTKDSSLSAMSSSSVAKEEDYSKHSFVAWVCILFVKAVRKVSVCILNFINRQLVQVLQWWAASIIILVHMQFYRMYQLTKTFHPDSLLDWIRKIPSDFDDKLPPWLWWFSVYAWAALTLAFALTILMIVLQFVAHMGDKNLDLCAGIIDKRTPFIISGPRDVSIQVLLLPMVYGFLTAQSVGMTWRYIAGRQTAMEEHMLEALHGNNGTVSLDTRFEEVYESNFALADFYEAFALYAFCMMVLQVLRPELRKKINTDVIKAIESILNVDVVTFVIVCVATAVWDILVNYAKYRLLMTWIADLSIITTMQEYFVGANWAASCIAIYNIYTFEHKFHNMKEMKSFKPSLKFWSIKIMVMIAFWATIVMKALNEVLGLTSIQSLLLDASCRMYAVTFVSILNVAAWWPWASWYQHVLRSTKELEKCLVEPEEMGMSRAHSEPFTLGAGLVPETIVHMVNTACPSLEKRKIGVFDNVKKEVEKISKNNPVDFERQLKDLIKELKLQVANLEKPTLAANKTTRRRMRCCPCRTVTEDVPQAKRMKEMKDAFIDMMKNYYPEGGDF